MVKVPDRELVEGFAATEKVTEPGPLPLLAEVIVINAALLIAVQLQPAPAVTFAVAAPPLEEKLCEVGFIEKEHPPVAPLWVTVKICPAMVIVPVLGVVAAFAVTE
jgi:hypothetical protein